MKFVTTLRVILNVSILVSASEPLDLHLGPYKSIPVSLILAEYRTSYLLMDGCLHYGLDEILGNKLG